MDLISGSLTVNNFNMTIKGKLVVIYIPNSFFFFLLPLFNVEKTIVKITNLH